LDASVGSNLRLIFEVDPKLLYRLSDGVANIDHERRFRCLPPSQFDATVLPGVEETEYRDDADEDQKDSHNGIASPPTSTAARLGHRTARLV
jgi:hypothetical protein